ncbi:MAG: response regulator [Myxococcota bacterium]|nr:response regulator [Myxococcota bacterium]
MPLSRASLERLVEASPDIVIATEGPGVVSFYNDGAVENLGYAREEIIGAPVLRLYPSRAEAKRVMDAMRDPDQGGRNRVVNFPTTFVAKDGHEIPVAISGEILADLDGREHGTIGFAKDLSEFIRRDQLAVLGEIAIGLSHQINNPLAVITNQLRLLGRLIGETGSAEQVERIAAIGVEVGRIEQQLQRLSQMAARDEYLSTDYIGDARMLDLEPQAASSLDGRRVLVVDDDTAVRRTVSDVLRAEGCYVEGAKDGRDALDRLGQASWDAVISDVVMPGLDGYELFQAVRRDYANTRIILMTAFYYDKDHIIKRSRLEGLDGVLFKKPVDPGKLIETLSRLLS